MRSLLSLLSVLALAACEPPSGSESGVGFQDYSAYQEQQAYLARSRAAREGPPLAALPPGPVAPGAPLTALAPAGSSPGMPPSESQVIAAQTLTALGRAPEVGAPPPPPPSPPSPVMAPAPLPAQTAAPTASSGANIVAYALSTSHPVGQQMYRRSGLGPSRFERNCAQYASDGLAQEAFLSRGGPERDPLGIDPDGDGYACRWDPTPFRAARG